MLFVESQSGAYPILLTPGALGRLAEVIPNDVSRVAIVTNPTVGSLYLQRVLEACGRWQHSALVVTVPDGEAYKTWDSLDLILSALLREQFDRRCLLVALGGGVIGDMTGLAAALFQRGVRYVQAPTTLLAQVDSSVGGKTAINHPLGKNMIGAFHPPIAVLSDPLCLQSLPDREISAGLAEIVKHGLLVDNGYWLEVEQAMPGLRGKDATVLSRIVEGSCRIKAEIVSRDERESGVREWLNLGHTFGHAIEAGLGYGQWLHGEAVGCGLVMATRLSTQLGLLDASWLGRVQSMVAATACPTRAPRLTSGSDAEELAYWWTFMSGDKKARHGQARFVVYSGIGQVEVRAVDQATVAQVILDSQA